MCSSDLLGIWYLELGSYLLCLCGFSLGLGSWDLELGSYLLCLCGFSLGLGIWYLELGSYLLCLCGFSLGLGIWYLELGSYLLCLCGFSLEFGSWNLELGSSSKSMWFFLACYKKLHRAKELHRGFRSIPRFVAANLGIWFLVFGAWNFHF